MIIAYIWIRCAFFSEMQTQVYYYNTTTHPIHNVVISSVAGDVRLYSSPLVSNVTLRVSRNAPGTSYLNEIKSEVSHVGTTLTVTLAVRLSQLVVFSLLLVLLELFFLL